MSSLNYTEMLHEHPPICYTLNLILNNRVGAKIGTSFSAPRVTSLIGGINSSLDERFNPRLLKALLIHHSKYPKDIKMKVNDKLNLMGYGVPSSNQRSCPRQFSFLKPPFRRVSIHYHHQCDLLGKIVLYFFL